MDDDEYVATLLAILTNPDPPGVDPDDPYQQSADGIDRSDGFGTELVVEAIERVPGRYGEELEVRFLLDLPPGETRVPARAATNVPFDAQWRRLSGYDDPAAYAPVVAGRVWFAGHKHVVLHRDHGGRPRQPVDPDVAWQELMAGLAGEHRVDATAPGRATVRLADRDITIVIEPGETFDDAACAEELLDTLDEDEHFIVAFDGRLHRSTRAELPPVPGRALQRRWQELRERGGGGWYAHRPGAEGR